MIHDIFQSQFNDLFHPNQGRKWSKEEIELFHRITYTGQIIPHEKEQKIQTLINIISGLCDALLPLYQLNLHFDIYLQGQLLNDILLNDPHNMAHTLVHNNMQDEINLVIKYHSVNKSNKKDLMPHYKTIEKIINLDVHDIKNWFGKKRHDNNGSYTTHNILPNQIKAGYLIFHALKKYYSDITFHIATHHYDYNPHIKRWILSYEFVGDINHHETISQRTLNQTTAVFEIKKTKEHPKINIFMAREITTDTLNIVEGNLFQASIALISFAKSIKYNFPIVRTPREFLQNVSVTSQFLKDIHHKTFTLDFTYYKTAHFLEFFEKKLSQIKELYPDYQFNFICKEPEDNIYTSHNNHLLEKKKIVSHYNLTQTLIINPTKTKAIKI